MHRLIVDGLAQERGGTLLFRDLSFSVAAGEALVLRGPNGSGKTTLLRTIAGLIPPIAGTARLEGGRADNDLGEEAHFVGHANAIKGRLTVRENLQFWAAYLGGGSSTARALEDFALTDLVDIPASYLSAGQKRRLGLARIAAAPRPLWLLDEPTVSLDQANTVRFAALMRRHLDGGGIVVTATHIDLGLAGARSLDLGSLVGH